MAIATYTRSLGARHCKLRILIQASSSRPTEIVISKDAAVIEQGQREIRSIGERPTSREGEG